MTEKKIDTLFREACERCESYSVTDECEDESTCPVYALYKAAKSKRKTRVEKVSDDWSGCQGYCDFEKRPRPEMI